MELLLNRNEKGRGKYELFAKLELNPEEEAHIRKAQPEKTFVCEGDERTSKTRWRLCLIPGAILALIVTFLLPFIHPLFSIFGIIVGAILWIPFTKLIFNQVRPGVTVADLITGRTIRCKTIDELYMKEHEINKKTKEYCTGLEYMRGLGNEQSIKLSPEQP